MNLVKAWQEKTKEPKAVPAIMMYKNEAYQYKTSIYLGVGDIENKDCMKGIRMDIYRSLNPKIKPAATLNMLNKVRSYITLNDKKYMFDLNGDGMFVDIGGFKSDTCFKDWGFKKFDELRK